MKWSACERFSGHERGSHAMDQAENQGKRKRKRNLTRSDHQSSRGRRQRVLCQGTPHRQFKKRRRKMNHGVSAFYRARSEALPRPYHPKTNLSNPPRSAPASPHPLPATPPRPGLTLLGLPFPCCSSFLLCAHPHMQSF